MLICNNWLEKSEPNYIVKLLHVTLVIAKHQLDA